MMTCRELAAVLVRVREAGDGNDQPLLDLSELDLAALEFICKLIPGYVIESLELNDATVWGPGAVTPEVFMTRDEKRVGASPEEVQAEPAPWSCPADSQECTIRQACTNKCGRLDHHPMVRVEVGSVFEERDRLRTENDRLREDVMATTPRTLGDKLVDASAQFGGTVHVLRSEIDRLRAENKKMRESVQRVETLLGDSECECECECKENSSGQHDAECDERCIPCRLDAALKGETP